MFPCLAAAFRAVSNCERRGWHLTTARFQWILLGCRSAAWLLAICCHATDEPQGRCHSMGHFGMTCCQAVPLLRDGKSMHFARQVETKAAELHGVSVLGSSPALVANSDLACSARYLSTYVSRTFGFEEERLTCACLLPRAVVPMHDTTCSGSGRDLKRYRFKVDPLISFCHI